MRHGWLDFLRGTANCGHGAHLYANADELAESVGAYLAEGFGAGEPALVVATREHLAAFAAQLSELGLDAERLEQDGLLVVVDSDSALRTIVRGDDGAPSQLAFDALIGTLLDDAAARFAGRRLRVFGDMVDRLCEQGRTDAALALEKLWNELAARRPFSLLCGYRRDALDGAAATEISRLHSHVLAL